MRCRFILFTPLIERRTTSGPPFTVLSPAASGSKQTASVKVASFRQHGPSWTLESVSEKRKIQGQPHTREIGRWRSSPTPLTDQRSWSPEQSGLRDEGQVRHRQQCGMPEDRPSRNNSPGSSGNTFAVRSAAQLPTPTGRLMMEGSCSIWRRSTEVRRCLKTVWDNLAQAPGLCVLRHKSDRSAVAGATHADLTLLSVSSALGTPFRTDDSPGIRTQWPVVWQLGSNLPRAHSQCLSENRWTTARFRTAASETSS